MRPDVLEGQTPRSLAGLAIRLSHPMSLSLALSRLPLPALQVAEALAALGPDADRAVLEHLLGLDRPGAEPAGQKALTRELDRLAAYGLLIPGTCALEPTLDQVWSSPLNLHLSVHTFVPTLIQARLSDVLTAWRQPQPEPLRKASSLKAVLAVLTDAERVRAEVASTSAEMSDTLQAAAFGQRYFVPFGYSSHYASSRRNNPLAWALDRLLLVPSPSGALVMPREVALALRGPDWHAPFTPDPPVGSWRPVPERDLRSAAAASGAQTLQLVGDVLQSGRCAACPGRRAQR